MAGKPKPARIVIRNGDYSLVYWDYATGKRVQKKCTALKAFTYNQRVELVKQYQAKELNQQIDLARIGGRVDGNSRLVDDIKLYLEYCDERKEVREANPKAGLGISVSTHEIITHNVGHFAQWIKDNKGDEYRTNELDPHTLRAYINFVTIEGTKLGTKKAQRSASTINQYIRNVKTCIRWISRSPVRGTRWKARIARRRKPARACATRHWKLCLLSIRKQWNMFPLTERPWARPCSAAMSS